MKPRKHRCIEGGSTHPVFNTWYKMVGRCTDPDNKDFKYYGGRGITVCARWLDFSKFASDMIGSWEKGLTIERINNSLGYSPDNCRWATRAEQSLNTRRNHKITSQGITKTLHEWAELLKIHRATLFYRIELGGLTTDRALSTPARKHK